MHALSSFLSTVQLPTIPDLAHRLIKTLNNDDADVDEIGDLISRDPAISAKLIRLANSASFGLSRQVASISDAIAMIGLQRVKMLALGSCLNNAFPSNAGLDMQAFWKTSMACAGYSEWLARHLKKNVDPQAAWLTGMMMRLGEILIAQAQPTTVVEIERLPQRPGVRWEREEQMLSFNEGQITAELARRWNFPEEIVHALDVCSNPMHGERFSVLGAILHLASLLADIPNAGPEHLEILPPAVYKALGLSIEWMTTEFPSNADFVDAS